MEQYQRLSGFLIINFYQFFSYYFRAFIDVLSKTVILTQCLYSGTWSSFLCFENFQRRFQDVLWQIFGALHDLVAFVQFKKREKHSWRSVNFS